MNPIQDKLALQSHLMKDWPGEPLGDSGLLRILNAKGSLPPLIWCFNSHHEFPLLAQTLGPDQPLIGLRSLMLIARMEPGRARMDQAMGEHIADLLLTLLPTGACHVGGNCQAVPVAARVAMRLLLAERDVRSFTALEWEPGLPLPLPTKLLFGAESNMFNPELRGDAHATGRWSLLFGQPTHETVPGGHGEYFTNSNIGALAAAIRRGMTPPCTSTPSDLPKLRVRPLPETMNRSGAVSLDLFSDGESLPEGLWLAYLWRDVITGEVQPVAGQPLTTASMQRVQVQPPVAPGAWDLIAFPTLPPLGPLRWQDHLDPVARIIVTAQDHPA